MTDNPEFVQVGPWSTFDRPLPVPGPDPDEDELVPVCFPKSYLPYLYGALWHYTQRETWEGSGIEITTACQQWELLLGMLMEDCMAGLQDVRTDPTNTLTLQKTFDGEEWIDFAHLLEVRQNEEEPCKLERTYDNDTWSQWADTSLCAGMALRIVGNVLQVWDSNTSTWLDAQNTSMDNFDWQTQSYQLPARTGADKKCLSAANAVAVFVELHAEFCDWYAARATVLTIVGLIGAGLALLFPLTAVAVGALLGAEGLTLAVLQYTSALSLTAFTESIKDDLRCIFYRNADENGEYDDTTFADVLAEVQAKSGAMWSLLYIYLNDVAGRVGLNNAGKTNSVTDTACAMCDATGMIDFLDGGLHGFAKGYGDGGAGVALYSYLDLGMWGYDTNQSGGPWLVGGRVYWDDVVPEGATQVLVDFYPRDGGSYQVDLGWSNAPGTEQTIFETDINPNQWYNLPGGSPAYLGFHTWTQGPYSYNIFRRIYFK